MTQSAGIRHFTDIAHIDKDTECAIVLGGDGTMIQAAIDLVHTELPIIGVNTEIWVSLRKSNIRMYILHLISC